jgi:hypothetical protein
MQTQMTMMAQLLMFVFAGTAGKNATHLFGFDVLRVCGGSMPCVVDTPCNRLTLASCVYLVTLIALRLSHWHRASARSLYVQTHYCLSGKLRFGSMLLRSP